MPKKKDKKKSKSKTKKTKSKTKSKKEKKKTKINNKRTGKEYPTIEDAVNEAKENDEISVDTGIPSQIPGEKPQDLYEDEPEVDTATEEMDARIREYMENVVKELTHQTTSFITAEKDESEDLRNMLEYATMNPGKMIRPVLCFLVCDALRGNKNEAKNLALAVQFTHNASLVQDDIFDADLFRRGKLTLPIKFNVGSAILAADKLMSFAVGSMSSSSPEHIKESAKIAAETWSQLTTGVQLEKTQGRDFDKEKYLEIIANKTASLFSMASEYGALTASTEVPFLISFIFAPFDTGKRDEELKQREACRNYGFYMGMAFQLADDLCDIIKSIKTGELQGDMKIENRLATYPLILLHEGKPEIRDLLKKFAEKKKLDDTEMIAIFEGIKRVKGIEKTQELIEDYVFSAQDSIKDLPESEYKELLMHLPDYSCRMMLGEA